MLKPRLLGIIFGIVLLHSVQALSESLENETLSDSVSLNSSEKYFTWRHKQDWILLTSTIGSCFFLCLTILTYVLLPSLRNIHGKAILCHLISLLISFLLQMIEDFSLPDIRSTEPTYHGHFCWIIGFLLYFFTLSSNFWLTIVNFDIWNMIVRNTESKRFSVYCALALGIPAFLSVMVFILELSLPVGSNFKPSIGTTRCFLPPSPTYSILLYMYLVMGVLLLLNFTMFTWTTVALCTVQSMVSHVKSASKSTQIFQRVFLFFKLFCVMGTTWTISITFWILSVHKLSPDDKSGLIKFFEVFNVSHGFCYFIVFVCKPSVFRMLKERIIESTNSSTGKTSCSAQDNSASAKLLKT